MHPGNNPTLFEPRCRKVNAVITKSCAEIPICQVLFTFQVIRATYRDLHSAVSYVPLSTFRWNYSYKNYSQLISMNMAGIVSHVRICGRRGRTKKGRDAYIDTVHMVLLKVDSQPLIV